MASIRDIKRRRESIRNTQQITRAMMLVSTVKLQRAKSRAEQFLPYFEGLRRMTVSVLQRAERSDHPFLGKGSSEKKALILITSNRGLAGGYNTGMVKLVTGTAAFKKENLLIYAVGRKGREALERRGYEIREDASGLLDAPGKEFHEDAPETPDTAGKEIGIPGYAAAAALGQQVLSAYTAGEVGEIYIAYTHFKNTVSQEPRLFRILPVEPEAEEGDRTPNILMNFEPDEESVLDQLIPAYMAGIFYGALAESAASEHGARMQAMDAATGNAEEMIRELTLQYNRARQSAITRELTEMIAGASGIS